MFLIWAFNKANCDTYITVGRKGLPGTNALAYLGVEQMSYVKLMFQLSWIYKVEPITLVNYRQKRTLKWRDDRYNQL